MTSIARADVAGLRTRLAELRKDLTDATNAYREAAANHDAQRAIPLLRSRGQLMRALLEAQCELLLQFQVPGPAPIPVADTRVRAAQNAVA